jgi:hypothetical protein
MDWSKCAIGIDLDPTGECGINNASIEANEQVPIDGCIHRSHISAQLCCTSTVLLGSGDERASTREVEKVSNFTIACTRSDPDRNTACAFDTNKDGMNRRTVGHHHRDAFTTFWFGSKDRTGDVISVSVILRPRISTSVSDKCDAVGLHRGSGRNDRADCVVSPPTPLVILGRSFRISAEKFRRTHPAAFD